MEAYGTKRADIFCCASYSSASPLDAPPLFQHGFDFWATCEHGVAFSEARCGPATGHKAKKRKQESVDEDNMASNMQMSIALPSSLKKQLINDWELITKDGKLVPLPRKPSVKNLLQQYLDEAGGDHRKDTISE
eukprot:395531-Prorocentrum_minimum.AAC.7